MSNPLQDGLRLEPTPGPTTLVIFGGTGDLTRRKLLPALYHLSRGQRLPAQFSIVGVARDPKQAIPLRGSYDGEAEDFKSMSVQVNVTTDEFQAKLHG